MAAQKVEQKVIVKAGDGKTSEGVVTVEFYSRKMRWRRTVKILTYSLVLAVLSALIPIAHLILTPLFLLGGPLIAYLMFGQASFVLGGMSTCPHCQKPLPLVAGSNSWPMEDTCGHCHMSITIEKCS